jgi:hypothetical protein
MKVTITKRFDQPKPKSFCVISIKTDPLLFIIRRVLTPSGIWRWAYSVKMKGYDMPNFFMPLLLECPDECSLKIVGEWARYRLIRSTLNRLVGIAEKIEGFKGVELILPSPRNDWDKRKRARKRGSATKQGYGLSHWWHPMYMYMSLIQYWLFDGPSCPHWSLNIGSSPNCKKPSQNLDRL